jgi:hypothetical protein
MFDPIVATNGSRFGDANMVHECHFQKSNSLEKQAFRVPKTV